ncbi:16S rRNA (uracil(1498)-N(3))-methyltransferase [Thalassobaculum salexigens]|uniref:16S rRNA (uracil(1498)-N(3))-methyltransferase n=1 Tax=Thalassobaculum salexigens TaxID=455360 RepID=UPI0031EB2D80
MREQAMRTDTPLAHPGLPGYTAPMKDGIETRLYVDAPLAAGGVVALGQDQAHYLKNVLRLGPGEGVALFNGRDGEWRAEIAAVAKKSADLAVIEQTRPQRAEPDVWLAFAPIKRARIDFTAQKATELGASVLWPVMTRHTMVDRVNTERLRANAVEAAEQSDRLTVPDVREPAKLEALIEAWPADRALILADETGGPPIAEALSMHRERPMTRAGFLIGPEGGFAEPELDRLRKLPFVTRVSLGERLLRADTAALAVLAIWQALVGDWTARHD